ncbi:hypothetical protein K458DRAFT_487711 [Lentithecium fluviatile CBS 122367]|uniref:Uncharacterized protein n=1 Tax=Lentithecium fluviatile CBS 122367 TaxID=1168545 RepID=A0A6G1IZ73_9PLEO|nr:hypothetical protein K458DRAFT_487711 [Lentithecium fluviatile CBS 122367]
MSSCPSNNSSPSKSPEPSTRRATSITPEASNRQSNPAGNQNSAETPQPTAGPRPFSTPPDLSARRSITSHPRPPAPLIFINESTVSDTNSPLRLGRSLVARHSPRSSSSQPPHRSRTPYGRPTSLGRAHSQPRSEPTTTSAAMSSASSSPGNTSTAGSSSNSNPSYQLPYAPFPYPMPKPQGGNGGSGKSRLSTGLDIHERHDYGFFPDTVSLCFLFD